MMKRFALLTIPYLFAPGALLADQNSSLCDGANVGGGSVCSNGNPSGADAGLTAKIGSIVNVLLYLAAAIAVIVIIVGGIRYVTSTGDAKRIQQAKDTIFYAVAGLIIAILAYAVVNFIVVHIGGQ